ncbi:MAG: hypothetical protein ACREX9_09125 [Gammaproteobacteria bacterium]
MRRTLCLDGVRPAPSHIRALTWEPDVLCVADKTHTLRRYALATRALERELILPKKIKPIEFLGACRT